MIPRPSTTTKYGFRIRTRGGLTIENLMIHGRDEADARRKLVQMYRNCEVLACRAQTPARSVIGQPPTFAEVIELVSK
ncbi:MAG: hypothetical protein IT515_17820 [Burkholderiales bacterium]|nr:hypothetical protein [Burkholderiales bacterium]